MTRKTREYLADLALRKGVKLPGLESASQAVASDKIKYLTKLPDVAFAGITAEDLVRFSEKIARINKELEKWTLTA